MPDRGQQPPLTVDEVLAIGAQAIFALSDEMQEQHRSIGRLQNELSAAYRSSAIAAADAVEAARRETEVADARADALQRKANARERELQAAVLTAHEQLAESQRAGNAVAHGAQRATAGGRLLEHRLAAVREAVLSVVGALPPSAAEVTHEAEVLAATAAGRPPSPSAALDELALLAKALERAGRCTEQNRACVAESQLVRAELGAERAALAAARDEYSALTELHRASQEEKVALRRELADAHAGREEAEEAARRFQALLQVGIEHASREAAAGLSAAGGPRSPGSPSAPLGAMTPAGAASAAAAVDGLEAAVREAAELTALLARPATASEVLS